MLESVTGGEGAGALEFDSSEWKTPIWSGSVTGATSPPERSLRLYPEAFEDQGRRSARAILAP